MKIEILLSAMNQSDLSLFEKSKCCTDLLIINQTDHEGYEESERNGCKIRMYSTTQRGLSRSRNMALVHALGDICLFADDDCVMAEGYEKLIEGAFKRHPDAAAIAFNYNDPNRRSKKAKIIETECIAPKNKSFSSVSLAFRRSEIQRKGIWFNVNLGAGSGFISAGEETVWEDDLRRSGLNLYQCPDYITEVQQQNSTWFTGYNEKYFYDLGAVLSLRYNSFVKYLYQFYYPIRLKGDAEMSIVKQIKYMIAGMQGVKKGLNYEQYFKINEKV